MELAEVRGAEDGWTYFEEAKRIATKKHVSYDGRGLFRNPIILVLHSRHPSLFDMKAALAQAADTFAGVSDGTLE